MTYYITHTISILRFSFSFTIKVLALKIYVFDNIKINIYSL